jgi:hypothetical protein
VRRGVGFLSAGALARHPEESDDGQEVRERDTHAASIRLPGSRVVRNTVQ